ncbi:uncharacterized protein LOC130132860 [Lampris incognitus]|uniref:uncharacterized protein LOC130132860 n=1 Tax=Lampris incognitus TaxID=2546036 RepID=UPI0024B5CAE3|nr:uncharacterized protein LOC130132860 [Lampris incognitus]
MKASAKLVGAKFEWQRSKFHRLTKAALVLFPVPGNSTLTMVNVNLGPEGACCCSGATTDSLRSFPTTHGITPHLVVLFYTLHGKGYFTVDVKLFGQGTRLYVTEEEPRTPRVGVYQASTADGKGKSTLVCLVTDMHPDLVRISWKAERERGQSNTVEQRDHKSTTSMIQINKEELSQMDYTCSVQHQTGIKTVVIKSRVVSTKGPTTVATPTHIPSSGVGTPQDTANSSSVGTPQDTVVSFQSVCRVKLASVVYSLMIVKSIVYCCGLSLLLIHTNKRGC